MTFLELHFTRRVRTEAGAKPGLERAGTATPLINMRLKTFTFLIGCAKAEKSISGRKQCSDTRRRLSTNEKHTAASLGAIDFEAEADLERTSLELERQTKLEKSNFE